MMVRTMCTRSLLGGRAESRGLPYDADEALRIEARASDEGSVDLGLGHQGLGILGLHAATIQDAHGLGDFLGPKLGDKPPQIAVHLGGLPRRRVDSRPDRPHGLV